MRSRRADALTTNVRKSIGSGRLNRLAERRVHWTSFAARRPIGANLATCGSTRPTIRARVEHVFAVVKRLWGFMGFTKVRYRGLGKNANRAFVALALTNVYLSRRRLMAQVRP